MKERNADDYLIVECNNPKCSMRLHFKCEKGDCAFPNFIAEILSRLRIPMQFHRTEKTGTLIYYCPHCQHWRKFRRQERFGRWLELKLDKDKKKIELIPVKFD
jgi:hypothetical protein